MSKRVDSLSLDQFEKMCDQSAKGARKIYDAMSSKKQEKLMKEILERIEYHQNQVYVFVDFKVKHIATQNSEAKEHDEYNLRRQRKFENINRQLGNFWWTADIMA